MLSHLPWWLAITSVPHISKLPTEGILKLPGPEEREVMGVQTSTNQSVACAWTMTLRCTSRTYKQGRDKNHLYLFSVSECARRRLPGLVAGAFAHSNRLTSRRTNTFLKTRVYPSPVHHLLTSCLCKISVSGLSLRKTKGQESHEQGE